MQEEASLLRRGLARLSLSLHEHQVEQLLAYLSLLQKWNQVYNLTAVRDPLEMVTHHLLDSLAVVAPLQKQLSQFSGDIHLLDVGAGAGLPGVVLAITCPGITVHCVDAVAKKTAFVRHVALGLKLPHLQGMHARVESLKDRCYDIISSRAFASLADFSAGSRAVLAPNGLWMAMKGKLPAREMESLPQDIRVVQIDSLDVPGLGAERCVVWMRAGMT